MHEDGPNDSYSLSRVKNVTRTFAILGCDKLSEFSDASGGIEPVTSAHIDDYCGRNFLRITCTGLHYGPPRKIVVKTKCEPHLSY